MTTAGDEDTALATWAEGHIFDDAPFEDVSHRVPGFTDQDAYRLRAELVRRRCVAGDALAGYKVAGSSRAIRTDEHVEGPIVGCVMRSRVWTEAEPIHFAAPKIAIEAEIGVLLKRDLCGPGVTLLDAAAAVDCVFPAFEILSMQGGKRPSHQARILASNFRGGFVFGGPPTSINGIDLRLEGMALSINGELRGSATGVEVLGHPLAALPLIANTLASSGGALAAGMIVMTGSMLANMPVKPGDEIEAAFSRLGRIAIHFSR
jgi:2-keto-4-pentenoate hydratase